jgi:hypothetical protein
MNLIAHANTLDRKIILQYVVPITLLVFTNCTVVWQVMDTEGGPDHLYGFPLPYATSAFACSFCNVIAVFPLIIDLACVALVVTAAIFMLHRHVQALPTNKWLILLALTVSAISLGLHFMGELMVQDNFWRSWLDISPTFVSWSLQFGPLGL